MRIGGRWPVRFVLLTTCALAVVGGVAYANSGSSSTTVIRACRNKTTGLLRVVNAGANCRTGETLLSWNVDGPAGPSGRQGRRATAEPPEPPARREGAVVPGRPARQARRALPGSSDRLARAARRACPSTRFSLRITVQPAGSTSTRRTQARATH